MEFMLKCASWGTAKAYYKEASKFIVRTELNEYDEEELIIEINTIEELMELMKNAQVPLILDKYRITIYDDYNE
jgi:hypothetical protein